MSKTLSRRISIFLSLDGETVYDSFNPHDPVPIYKRQLGHQFQDYILSSVESAKRYSLILYKVICMKEAYKHYAEPLINATTRHFSVKRFQLNYFLKETHLSDSPVNAKTVIINKTYQYEKF